MFRVLVSFCVLLFSFFLSFFLSFEKHATDPASRRRRRGEDCVPHRKKKKKKKKKKEQKRGVVVVVYVVYVVSVFVLPREKKVCFKSVFSSVGEHHHHLISDLFALALEQHPYYRGGVFETSFTSWSRFERNRERKRDTTRNTTAPTPSFGRRDLRHDSPCVN